MRLSAETNLTATPNQPSKTGQWFPLLLFFALAFGITFALSHLPPFQILGADVPSILCGFGPLVSGLICYQIFRTPNRHRISLLGVRPVIPCLLLGSAAIAAFGLRGKNNPQAFGVLLVSQMIYSFGEEFGWRHYLQNATAGWNKWASAGAIGTVWFCWHYAFIADPIRVLTGQKIPFLIGAVICIFVLSLLSLMLGDLVVKTKSILLPTLLHGVTKFGDPITLAGIFTLLLLLQILWNPLKLAPTELNEKENSAPEWN